jgi:hypothetical protein
MVPRFLQRTTSPREIGSSCIIARAKSHEVGFFSVILCPVCASHSDRPPAPLRDIALLFFSRKTTSSEDYQMLFSRRGAETLRKAKSFTLQGSFFSLRLCVSARYIFYSSPARLLHPVKATKCFSPAETLGRREQRLKAFKHSLVLGSPLRPCASARYFFCSSPTRLLHPVKATKQ